MYKDRQADRQTDRQTEWEGESQKEVKFLEKTFPHGIERERETSLRKGLRVNVAFKSRAVESFRKTSNDIIAEDGIVLV